MPLPPPNARFRKIVRGFYLWLGSLLIAGIAPLFALQLVESHAISARIAGVVLGTVAWIPMVAVIAGIIRAGDEFQRRIHLVALALSFASALLLLTLLDWLARAEFIWPPRLQVIWLAFAGLWVIWLFIVKRHYERHP